MEFLTSGSLSEFPLLHEKVFAKDNPDFCHFYLSVCLWRWRWERDKITKNNNNLLINEKYNIIMSGYVCIVVEIVNFPLLLKMGERTARKRRVRPTMGKGGWVGALIISSSPMTMLMMTMWLLLTKIPHWNFVNWECFWEFYRFQKIFRIREWMNYIDERRSNNPKVWDKTMLFSYFFLNIFYDKSSNSNKLFVIKSYLQNDSNFVHVFWQHWSIVLFIFYKKLVKLNLKLQNDQKVAKVIAK